MIRSLHIESFKSLRNLSLDLTELNIFLGPNAAGKSNIIKALKLLHDILTTGSVSRAVSLNGGPSELAMSPGTKSPRIKFRATLDLSGTEPPFDELPVHGNIIEAEYGIEFACLPQAPQEIIREDLSFTIRTQEFRKAKCSDKRYTVISRTRNRMGGEYLSREFGGRRHLTRDEWPISIPMRDVPGATSQGMRDDTEKFLSFIRQMRFYRIDVEKAREFGSALDGSELEPDGSNLAQVLRRMKEKAKQNRKSDGFAQGFLDFMRSAVPGFEDFEVMESTGLGKVTVSFRIREDTGTNFSPFSVSDGTIRAMCFYLGLFYHVKPCSLFTFEEPENCLHPYLLDQMMSVIKNNPRKTQVVLTTHSKTLVDMVEPRNVFLVSKENGATLVKRADSHPEIERFCRHYGVGEAWIRGLVGAVP